MLEQSGFQHNEVVIDTSFSQETFDSLRSQWITVQTGSRADFVFSFPEWQELCWRQFRAPSGHRLLLAAVRDTSTVIGIAPLVTSVSGDSASFIGTTNVCDYLDFIVTPGLEEVFFTCLFRALRLQGIKQLDLAPLRPDSTVFSYLLKTNHPPDLTLYCEPHDVSVEIDLPTTWEEFIQRLDGKQRHEVRRKLRKLNEQAPISYTSSDRADPDEIEAFLRLMRTSRRDKAEFMTPAMETYFRQLAQAMAARGVLKMGSLHIGNKTVAATMSFDYGNSIYLYNSGYDPEYAHLNVGLASKILCIRNSIESRKGKFDFLKGGEVYKFRLGGRKVPLQRCMIKL